MPSINEWKGMIEKGVQEARHTEEAYRADPSLANNASGRKHYRYVGGFMMLLGVAATVINYCGYQAAGRVFVLLIAANIVFLGSGVWMLLTGKNPFARLLRKSN